jgi:cysteine-rich repeat protein
VVFDDGNGEALYVGGHFLTAGGIPANHIAKWDGRSWTPLASGVNMWVYALEVFDDGSGPALYAGGGFSEAGGVPANQVAKWDGSTWYSVGDGFDGSVRALKVFDDGSGPALYVGGTNDVAKWDGSTWTSLPGGPDSSVYAMEVFDDGNGAALYVAGPFSTVGGANANHIAKWDGSTWTVPGNGIDGWVMSLEIFDDGGGPRLYAGGSFDTAGEVPANNIARWDGSTWTALGTGLSSVCDVLTVFDDGSDPSLYAGGSFFAAGGAPANHIAKWNGSMWSPVGGGVEGNAVLTLASFNDGAGSKLYVGGAFEFTGGSPANNISQWDGTSWVAPDPWSGNGLDGVVYALANFDDGTGSALYAGGDFAVTGGVPASNIARWDGSSWAPLASGIPYNNVTALTIFDDGAGEALYVGGNFYQAGGSWALSIAKWDGSTWASLGDGLGSNVFALTTFDDGSGLALYAGGGFSSDSGEPGNGIAKWDGARWSSLGSGLNDVVRTVRVFDDGSGTALYAGGSFTTAGGSEANRIARWDGAAWTTLGGGVNSVVFALAVFDDGSGPALYAGGAFTNAGGVSAGHIAKWDGSTWTAVGSGTDQSVRSLRVFDDGSGAALYAGGVFTNAGGASANHIAKWDGLTWTAVGTGFGGGTGQVVHALEVFDNGPGPGLYAGGLFGTAGGIASNFIASWRPLNCCGDGVIHDFEECDDLNTQSKDGCSQVCEVESGYVCAGEPSICTVVCSDFGDCADLDNNGVRDDNCVWWACAAGECNGTAVGFADMGGAFGTCIPDFATDANDHFHALHCFANSNTLGNSGYPCEGDPPNALNVDAGGPFGDCAPDGVCDGNDAFHAINAFSGATACSCSSGGPAPALGEARQPEVVGRATIELRQSLQQVGPGALVEVDVLLATPLTDLRGYQLHVGTSGGKSGGLELVDISIGKSEFNEKAGRWSAFNTRTHQMLAGLDGPGVSTPAGSHLATFMYRASADAAGTFAVELLHDDTDTTHRTFLFPTPANGKIEIAEAVPVTLEVAQPAARRSRVAGK